MHHEMVMHGFRSSMVSGGVSCLGAVLCGAGGAVVERTLLNVVVLCLVLSNFTEKIELI